MTHPRGAKPVAIALVISATLLFALNSGLSRVLLRSEIQPTTLISFRLTITVALLAGWAALTSPSSLRPPRGRLVAIVAVHGVIGVAALQTLFLIAVDRLTLGLALAVQYMAPLGVALWVRYVQRIRLPRGVWLGLGLSLLGLAAITQIWNGLTADPLGLVAAIASASCFATYFIVGEIAARTTATLRLLIWSFLAGAVGLAVVAPPWQLVNRLGADVSYQGRLDDIHTPLWVALACFVIVGTVVPYVMVLVSMRRLSATVVSNLHMLEPAAGFAIGWLWFSESMAAVAVLGCTAVIAGVLLAQRGTRAVSDAGTDPVKTDSVGCEDTQKCGLGSS
ncbi:EamA family transporter [Mycobacterium aquaticum]|uniref:EamA domain-containing protein n=1 Tax=Mycobacterium aquaticum TaxID=1927124 RepID=A0A1X0ATN6_9MYCO|nr:DMT family transporter [Mycobacterium aquaticum]ORA33431.1 hypothetical protein BST13_19390 [Mycobacterium aquaticum]